MLRGVCGKVCSPACCCNPPRARQSHHPPSTHHPPPLPPRGPHQAPPQCWPPGRAAAGGAQTDEGVSRHTLACAGPPPPPTADAALRRHSCASGFRSRPRPCSTHLVVELDLFVVLLHPLRQPHFFVLQPVGLVAQHPDLVFQQAGAADAYTWSGGEATRLGAAARKALAQHRRGAYAGAEPPPSTAVPWPATRTAAGCPPRSCWQTPPAGHPSAPPRKSPPPWPPWRPPWSAARRNKQGGRLVGS